MEEKGKKNIVFLLIVIVIIVIAFGLLINSEFIIQNWFWFLLLLIALWLVLSSDWLLQTKEFERAVIFRFGKVNRVGGPGWVIFFPPMESYTIVDTRVQTIDTKPQEIVTKDRVVLKIDAITFLKVKSDRQSVTNSVVNVENYKDATKQFVVSSIRDICGGMTMDEIITNVEMVNAKIKEALQEFSKEWGIAVEAVQFQGVSIPKELEEALHTQKAAEQKKLARKEIALGHQAEIEAVREAAEKLNDKALAYYYIRALEKISEGKSTKLIFPMELSNLAQAITGKISGSLAPKESEIESLFEKYKPTIQKLLKASNSNEEEKPGKAKNNKKKNNAR